MRPPPVLRLLAACALVSALGASLSVAASGPARAQAEAPAATPLGLFERPGEALVVNSTRRYGHSAQSNPHAGQNAVGRENRQGEWRFSAGRLQLNDDAAEWPHKVLVPVRWGRRLYLLDELELEEFAALDESTRRTTERFLLRAGDRAQPVEGDPELPLPEKLLLRPPKLRARVIEDHGHVYRRHEVVIDVGSEDGVRVGHRFETSSGDVYRVESVSASSCSARRMGCLAGCTGQPPLGSQGATARHAEAGTRVFLGGLPEDARRTGEAGSR